MVAELTEGVSVSVEAVAAEAEALWKFSAQRLEERGWNEREAHASALGLIVLVYTVFEEIGPGHRAELHSVARQMLPHVRERLTRTRAEASP